MRVSDLFEDVENDMKRSVYLQSLVKSFADKMKDWNSWFHADHHKARVNGKDAWHFKGSLFGWPSVYGTIDVLIIQPYVLGDNTLAAWANGNLDAQGKGSLGRLYIVGYDSDFVDTVHELLTKEKQSSLLHELVHAQQHIREIPLGKTTKQMNSKADYYNDPNEFDAYYHQASERWHDVLHKLRFSNESTEDIMKDTNLTGNFHDDLLNMAPIDWLDAGFDAWVHSEERQRRRWIKRLYALHQAIMNELEKRKLAAPE